MCLGTMNYGIYQISQIVIRSRHKNDRIIKQFETQKQSVIDSSNMMKYNLCVME